MNKEEAIVFLTKILSEIDRINPGEAVENSGEIESMLAHIRLYIPAGQDSYVESMLANLIIGWSKK